MTHTHTPTHLPTHTTAVLPHIIQNVDAGTHSDWYPWLLIMNETSLVLHSEIVSMLWINYAECRFLCVSLLELLFFWEIMKTWFSFCSSYLRAHSSLPNMNSPVTFKCSSLWLRHICTILDWGVSNQALPLFQLPHVVFRSFLFSEMSAVCLNGNGFSCLPFACIVWDVSWVGKMCCVRWLGNVDRFVQQLV